MRRLFALAALACLSGCATTVVPPNVVPLNEAERARIRVVAPAAARFPPKVEMPPGKAEAAAISGTAAGAAAAVAATSLSTSLICGPFYPACAAVLGIGGTITAVAFATATAPSSEEIERARSHLGAPDVQQLLAQRFSDRVTRLTPLTIDLSASKHGPESLSETPNYSASVASKGALVAELAVVSVRADLFNHLPLPLKLSLRARMRLVRPSDGDVVMTRYYQVTRHGRRTQEYEEDSRRFLQSIAGAVEEVAMLMVDDAFLLQADAVGPGGTYRPVVTALEPLPSSGRCLGDGVLAAARLWKPRFDCWDGFRRGALETVSPTFRWKPFPEPEHLETTPGLRAARNIVYDLWVSGADDVRVVEGLKTTEYTPERPLALCMHYTWAVRARFDTDAGPRTVEWSRLMRISSVVGDLPGGGWVESLVVPVFHANFVTPCPGESTGSQAASDKP